MQSTPKRFRYLGSSSDDRYESYVVGKKARELDERLQPQLDNLVDLVKNGYKSIMYDDELEQDKDGKHYVDVLEEFVNRIRGCDISYFCLRGSFDHRHVPMICRLILDTNLKRLSLDRASIGTAAGQQLADAISRRDTISLELSYIDLGSSLIDILRALSTGTNDLSTLRLEGMYMTDDCADMLSTVLSKRKIDCLRFVNCTLTSRVVIRIAEAIVAHPNSVLGLVIQRQRSFWDRASFAAIDLLVRHSHVSCLVLEDVSLTPRFLRPFADALRQSVYIQILDLSRNNINERNARRFMERIGCPLRLSFVNLCHTDIDNEIRVRLKRGQRPIVKVLARLVHVIKYPEKNPKSKFSMLPLQLIRYMVEML